jgi:hypothetical protein
MILYWTSGKNSSELIELSSINKYLVETLQPWQVEGIIDELTSIVGPKNISASQAVREQHGKDESYHSIRSPDLVVWPGSTEEVSNVAKLCNQHKIVMIPFGSGTGVEGGVAALEVQITWKLLLNSFPFH